MHHHACGAHGSALALVWHSAWAAWLCDRCIVGLCHRWSGLWRGYKSRDQEIGFDVPFIHELKHTKTGWTLGGGVETPFELFGLFGKNWTAKTEYLYVDLGKTTDTYALTSAGTNFGQTIESRVQEHIFRTGLNYHFNAMPAPVAARY